MNKLNNNINLYYILAESVSRENILRRYSSFLLIIGFISFVFPKTTFAQGDTNETAAKTDSIIEYLTPLEYAFMMHEETRFMLRVPAVGVGAELEVLPYLTLMSQLIFRVHPISTYSYLTFNAEMRYYYSSKKKGVRNMSGNYFAVGYDNPSIISDPSEQYYYGRWGIQRRFLGYGLIDIGINFGYSTYRKYNEFTDYSFSRDALFIQSTAQVGLGLVFGNEKALDKERLCSVIKCYTRETFLLKINTTNLFSVYHSTTEHQNEYRLSPKIAIEQKLFNLPVSIGTDFGLDYTYWTSNKENPYSRDYNLSVYTGRIQARYYYNLKN